MRAAVAMFALVVASGCVTSHSLEVDGGVTASPDAQFADDGGLLPEDGGPPSVDPGESVVGVPCGPNRCLVDEVCCNAACGVCAFEDECVDHGCPEP